ncbi:Protein-tyrosine-phosphatase [Tranquillimonas rosea]|uniref:Protein-tyrosine-phosphatase n=1 Tax=Tranquillimonas rosea TaxID=641238 RepID=A0A1H9SMM0_9RHOB|nr:arsenate reductase ArsC [Tranquillimonas rosea]SER86270.1 Protein-tyrosine-phosphatase [Tranquillimonas rosea]
MSRKNVLFLCNHNSARSIIAEVLLNDFGGDHYRAFSAGIRPGDGPHPMALETLRAHGHEIGEVRSKGAELFTGPDAPTLHYVITLCDSVAQEDCPVWPGQPERAQWRLPNPAAVAGSDAEKRAAFEDLYASLRRGLKIFAEDDERSLRNMALA